MKEDKSLLDFSSYNSLIEYQYEKLKPLFKNIYISAKSNKFDFLKDKSTLILDEEKDIYSPIIALESIFNKIKEEKIFIITVDTPFVKSDSINKLIENTKNYEVCVAKTERIHNLCGIFSYTLLSQINEMIKNDIHKVGYLLKNSKTNYLNFEDDNEFLNLNTRDDYKKALDVMNKYL